MENNYNKYDKIDNTVWSAFTLSQFPNINWKMEATSNFNDKCSVDQLVTANNATYNVELKTREYAAYDSRYIKDCWIEVDKFENIKKFPNQHNRYVAIYPYVKSGGVIYIWNLDQFTDDDLSKIKKRKLMNEKTVESKEVKVWKWVYELPTDKAQCFKFNSIQFYC